MNILVVKLSAIGDVIHALPVSYAIKETYPDAHLTWVVEPPAKSLLEDNPYIDEIIVFKKKEFKSLGGFLKNYSPLKKLLTRRKYDYALDLQGLFKSAAIVYTSGAEECYGMCNMRELSDKVSTPVVGKNANGHIVERYLDVARAIGCEVNEVKFPLVVSDKDSQIARQVLHTAGVPMMARYALLAVGANWPNKRWSPKSFAEFADWLYEKQIIPVIIGGGDLDESIAAQIEHEAIVPPINIVGQTNLKQLAEIIKGACLVVGGDTGPVHLAAGLKRPTLMLQGPTDANRNGPYGQTENSIEVKRPCKYCWKRACPKKFDCLAAIRLDEVTEKAEKILRL